MKIAFDLPTSVLDDVNPMADLDFVTVSRMRHDEAYANHYTRYWRELILFGDAMEDWPELLRAAKRINPAYIICPHRPNDGRFNLEHLIQSYDEMVPEQLGIVIAGSERERVALMEEALRRNVGLVCLPHTAARYKWFLHLRTTTIPTLRSVLRAKPLRLHLLGFISTAEMQEWRKLELLLKGELDLSMDILMAKPDLERCIANAYNFRAVATADR